MRWTPLPVMVICMVTLFCTDTSALDIQPLELTFTTRHQEAQIVVTGNRRDLTRDAKYSIADSRIAEVDESGCVRALGSGQTTIRIEVEGQSKELPVSVGDDPDTIDFHRDIRPIFSKAGCASGACHAAQHGQGGLKLSVFGFDPESDYRAIALTGRQRRLNFASPEASLLLRKPSGDIAHGGGRLLSQDSAAYALVHDWVATGALPSAGAAAEVASIEVFPTQIVGSKTRQQLRVVATYEDGEQRDVTSFARFDSLDQGLVDINGRGLAEVFGSGQSAIMVRYEGSAATATVMAPYAEKIELAGWSDNNYVDELARKKFQQLGIEPSGLCDDATFLRRAFLDVTGGLPTVEESTAFLSSTDPERRELLIDRLLGLSGDPAKDIYNDRYAAYWTLKWSDLIRNNSNSLGEQGMWSLHNWLLEQFRTNAPFDQLVYQLVTAKGSIYKNGPANFFRIHTNSSALAEATSQLFLGVRLECAKCHHHPFEAFSQADYYGLAAFFARVSSKNSEDFGLFGRETVVMVKSSGDVSHPRTRKRMEPTPLGGEPVDHELDRRIPFADWLTDPSNEYFAQSIVNRYVGYFMGSGLVNPIDDMRSTNPPSNKELLEELTKTFVESKFDLKMLLRTIMRSRVYQLSSEPTAQNKNDRQFYSHYQVKRIAAEPLLDAIDQVTEVPTKFKSLPLGTRAIELPDAEYPNYFLTTFAKPRRASVCECERSTDANLAQVLHIINGDILTSKIANAKGRIGRLLSEKKSHEQIVTELYLATLSRYPSTAEVQKWESFLQSGGTAKECYEDLLWALVNSKQFLHVH